MSTQEYIVDYRFGDIHDVREFITSDYSTKRLAEDLNDVNEVTYYNWKHIKYPLNVFGEPAPEAVFGYSRQWLFFYSYKKEPIYIWQFPYEVLVTELGICVDTANLVTTLLRLVYPSIGGIYTVLGRVYNADTTEFLGYHAWTQYADKWIETTIHEGYGNTDNIYIHNDGKTGELNGIRYIADIKFNEKEVVEMKSETKQVLLRFFGPKSDKAQDVDIWKKQEAHKQKAIWKKR